MQAKLCGESKESDCAKSRAKNASPGQAKLLTENKDAVDTESSTSAKDSERTDDRTGIKLPKFTESSVGATKSGHAKLWTGSVGPSAT